MNLLDRVPTADRWTHHYPAEGTNHQFDHLLASPSIANQSPNVVADIVGSGQPWRVLGIRGIRRYSRTRFDKPKASNHCPVAVTLSI
jgi:hypothetical protein